MNNQRTKLFCFALAICLLLSSVGAMAQNSKPVTVNDWSRLNSITKGSKLSVKLKSAQAVNGELGSLTDATLSLMVKGKSVDLKREEISSVSEIKKKSATKSTLIGLGVGAGAGAIIGVAGRGNNGFNKIDNAFTAGITVLGAGAGAFTGYLLGRRGAKRTLIYQASQP